MSEHGTGAAARTRLRAALHWRTTRAQFAVAAVLAVVGFSAVVQAHSTRTTGLAGLRQGELIRILDDTSQRTARLQAEANALEQSRARLTAGAAGREAALADARTRADELAILAGTVAAKGPGITLTVPPADGVTAASILDAVEELRDAGAEVLQVGGVRLVASTAFVDGPGHTVLVGGRVTRAPYVIAAIGSAQEMSTALRIPGGMVDTLAAAGSRVQITELPELTIEPVAASGESSAGDPASPDPTPVATPH